MALLGSAVPATAPAGSARGASPATGGTHAEPRLAFVPDAPPAPSLPASSACSALVPLPPAPWFACFLKSKKLDLSSQTHQGLQDLRGTTPAARKRGNVLIRCAALVLGDPQGERGGGPQSPRGFSSANPCRTMAPPHGPHVSLSWKTVWSRNSGRRSPGAAVGGFLIPGDPLAPLPPRRDQALVLTLCVHATLLSPVRLLVTPWTVARWAPPPMGFSGRESWSGLPFPPPGDRPDPAMEPKFSKSPAWAGEFFTTRAT